MKRLLNVLAVVATLAGVCLPAAPASAVAAGNSHIDYAVVGCSEDGNEIIVKWTLVSHVPEIGTIVGIAATGAGSGVPLRPTSQSTNIAKGEHIDAADVTKQPAVFGVLEATQNVPKDRAGTGIGLGVTIDYAVAANEEPVKQSTLAGCGVSNPTAAPANPQGANPPAGGAVTDGSILAASALLVVGAVMGVVVLVRRRRHRVPLR